MKPTEPVSTLAKIPTSVKSQLPLPGFEPPTPKITSKTMRHHKYLLVSYNSIKRGKPYGVSRAHRVLSPGLLLKKFDYIRDCLTYTLQLTIAQREVTLRLLRYWAYYGQVYPKESTVTEDPGCSKATFWRTLRLLKELGLIHVINRYVIRPHAQISNLYRLDQLVMLLARYLAEHGVHFWEKWLRPYLIIPAREFWIFQEWSQYKFPIHTWYT